MIKRIFISCVLALAAQQIASAEAPAVSFKTVQGIPTEDIKPFYTQAAWKAIYDAPIAGYVVMEGSVDHNDSVTISKIKESYPDHAHDVIAKQFAKRIRISASSLGTHIAAKADVYVIFYGTGQEPRQAVLFGKQQDTAFGRNVVGGDRYLEVVDYKLKGSPDASATAKVGGTTSTSKADKK